MVNATILLTFSLMASPGAAAAIDSEICADAAAPMLEMQHVDKDLGFKMSTPKKWNQIPIQNDERWIVGRFQSDKSDHFTDKAFGYTYDLKPELTMIAFTGESVEADIDLDGEEKDGEDEGSTVSGVVLFENPYKDYEEFLKKTYSGGGWYVDEEETKEVHGIKVTAFEIKVEKSSRGGPKRIKTWVYHLGHADVAVQFECFESAYDKHNRDFESRLKTFKRVERTEKKPGASSGFREIINDAETPEERKELRLTIEKEQHAKALANLPEDWDSEDDGRFLILSHVKKKHKKRIVDQVGMMFDWLDDNLDYVGKGEYVRRPIVRICANTEEMSIFTSGTGWSFTNIEILTCHDTSGFSDFLSGSINDRAFTYWFNERDRELYNRIPVWLKYGVDRMLHSGKAKGSRLVFEPDQWEMEGLREAIREDRVTLPSEMLRMTLDEMTNNQSLYREFGTFVRYLLVGKGSKDRKTKGLVREYLTHLRDIIDEENARKEAEGEPEEDEGPTTEEEEDAAFKARQSVRKERADALAKEVFDRTFDDWSEKDWANLDKAYLRSLK